MKAIRMIQPSVEESMESRVRRMRGVLTDLGLDMAQLEAATPRAGVGGPFVPASMIYTLTNSGGLPLDWTWNTARCSTRWNPSVG